MRSIRAVITLAALFILVAPSTSHAVSIETYFFTSGAGDCSSANCFGELVLKNYTEGQDADLSNFVSFTFSTNAGTAGPFYADDITGYFSANLGPTFPAPYDVEIGLSFGVYFNSYADGAYEAAFGDVKATGYSHVWNNATPLPAALPLFASGFAGLGWLAARRRKSTASSID